VEESGSAVLGEPDDIISRTGTLTGKFRTPIPQMSQSAESGSDPASGKQLFLGHGWRGCGWRSCGRRQSDVYPLDNVLGDVDAWVCVDELRILVG